MPLHPKHTVCVGYWLHGNEYRESAQFQPNGWEWTSVNTLVKYVKWWGWRVSSLRALDDFARTWQPTTISSSSSQESDALFWPLWVLYVHDTLKSMQAGH